LNNVDYCQNKTDSSTKRKIILVCDSSMRYDPITKQSNPNVGNYNAFRIGDGGPTVALGKNLENLFPYVKGSPETIRLLKKSKRNNKLENFCIAWCAVNLIFGIVMFKLTLILIGLGFFVLLILGVLAYLYFNGRAEKLMVRAVKKYNDKNGFGAVIQ
jgi:hypothetical protein